MMKKFFFPLLLTIAAWALVSGESDDANLESQSHPATGSAAGHNGLFPGFLGVFGDGINLFGDWVSDLFDTFLGGTSDGEDDDEPSD
uniref:Uncharacterized protein n=1 Tax=Sphaerodactylus townsendi TaxID=933632 RepID=A0ACB8EMF0_9SAUR